MQDIEKQLPAEAGHDADENSESEKLHIFSLLIEKILIALKSGVGQW